MGLFGGSSQTFVSSVVYNLAGDVNKRSNYLNSTVVSGLIGSSGQSISDTIRNAYLHGPGMQLRSFSKWAAGSSGYNDVVGVVTSQLITGDSLDSSVLAQQIPAPAGFSVTVQSSDLGIADITWWAEQWILHFKPQLIETNWHADYLMGQCYITYADRSVDVFVPVGFDPNGRYIFAAYNLTTGKAAGAVVLGTTVNLDATTPFPSTVDWTVVSNTMTPVTVVLANGSVQGINTVTVFEKTTYLGIDPANPTRTHSLRQIATQVQSVAAVGGVPKTTRQYRIDTQDVTNATQSNLNIFIYPFGSGNAVLDAMFAAPLDMGAFFPYIPIRVDDKFIGTGYQPEVYAMAKKGYKRATSGDFDDLISKVADNASLGDIDYAYVVFGVSLNVAEIASKKYIFAFFQAMMESQSFSLHAYTKFKTQWAAAAASQEAYGAWLVANGGLNTNGASAPKILGFPVLPSQAIGISTSKPSNMNYEIQVSWNGIESSFGAGMKSPDHGVGDIWFVVNGADTFTQNLYVTRDSGTSVFSDSFQVSNVTLYYQKDDNNWSALTLYGLLHKNLIYNGKAVETSVIDALNDTGESGFIIPLHEQIFRDMSLTDATQMSTACVYLVFNCYQIVKQKWYQTFIFQIIVIIIIIIITIVTWGTGTGPSIAGYAAIGTALGFEGLAAVLIGLAVSMVAAMVLSKILGLLANVIFGDKVGAIVGAIATVVVMVVGGNLVNGGDWTTAVSSLTEPKNLIQLTTAVGKGVAQYEQLEVIDLVKQTQDELDQYNGSMQTISDLYAKNIGSDGGIIDPLGLTDSANSNPQGVFVAEPPDTFLNRTLMTGSDIAELTTTLITEFTSLTLDISQNLST